MTPDQRKAAALIARELLGQASAIAQRALLQVTMAAPAGHDSVFAVDEARRAISVAGAKLDILIKRMP